MAEKVYLAIDLGASSGRHVAGRFDGNHLVLEEVYRFDNGPAAIGRNLYWDVLRLWSEIQHGLRLASQRYGEALVSLGVDTWGVDFGLLGRGDILLGNPSHYRDPRTNGVMERAFSLVGRESIFRHSGLQFMQFNTLYQLLAMKWGRSPLLDAAETFLMMPDLFHWMLTGQKCNEFTNATTTQLFDPARHAWSIELLRQFELPTDIFLQILEPGTRLGPLRSEVAADTGLARAEVILPGTHDTASAVMTGGSFLPGNGAT